MVNENSRSLVCKHYDLRVKVESSDLLVHLETDYDRLPYEEYTSTGTRQSKRERLTDQYHL